MTIYKSTKVLPYVYLCKEKNSERFYIGYRYKNYKPSSEDFGIHYFTSNDYVRENFDNFNHYILAEFFTKKDALYFESQLIRETSSLNQINFDKHLKVIGMKYDMTQKDYSPKKCANSDCQKMVIWRVKYCSPSCSGKCGAKPIAVSTSQGIFKSIDEASKQLNITVYYISKWAKNNENGYSYLTSD
jgi:hypothetical protein